MNDSDNSKRKKITKRVIIGAIVTLIFALSAVITFCSSLSYVPSWNEIFTYCGVGGTDHSKLVVCCINTGKSDCIFITDGTKNILVDSATKNESSNIISHLKSFGVEKLDLVIATHPDKDHIGSMADIIDTFPIDEFWYYEVADEIKPDSTVYQDMLTALKDNGVNVKAPQAGSRKIVDDMYIDVLSPKKSYDNTNDCSIVFKLIYKSTSFLFMGDASEDVEQDLLNSDYNLSADVIKIGHHGSKNSSCDDFLNAVMPKYAVICVGDNNDNLPNSKTLKRLQAHNIEYYRTDLSGDITAKSDGSNITFSFSIS